MRWLLSAQASVAGSQEVPSNLQKFRAHHPLTFTGGGDPIVADHWFIQIEKVLEAMEITSDTTRIRLVVFQLERVKPKYGGNGQGPLKTLEKPQYVSSLLGIRARIGMIYHSCELEISETLLTVDVRIMHMSEFDVILGMDWLKAYRVVIDCERRRATAYT